MSRCPYTSTVVWIGFPRVSGDEPGSETTTEPEHKFSPRERG